MIGDVESDYASVVEPSDLDCLHRLDVLLRSAIRASLLGGVPHLAVALDTARDFIEGVLAEAAPSATRDAIARARAEIALDAWRQRAAQSVER